MSTEQTEPTHGEIQELLGVYALDAVDNETKALVEDHLDGCVRCSAEVAQHHEVAGLLANSGGDSPNQLWDGISSQIDGSVPPSWERLAARLEPAGERPDRVIGPSTGSDNETGIPGESSDAHVIPLSRGRRRSQGMTRIAVAVAAAAAVVAIVLGAQVGHLHHQVQALQAQPGLSSAEQAALAQSSTTKVVLTGATSPDKVTVVLTKSGTGFVEADHLAPLGPTQTYQLWGVIDGTTISLGLLGTDPSVVPFSVAGNRSVQAFAITAERSGGVVQSSNKPVVAGEVTT